MVLPRLIRLEIILIMTIWTFMTNLLWMLLAKSLFLKCKSPAFQNRSRWVSFTTTLCTRQANSKKAKIPLSILIHKANHHAPQQLCFPTTYWASASSKAWPFTLQLEIHKTLSTPISSQRSVSMNASSTVTVNNNLTVATQLISIKTSKTKSI
jgi:hypothetical protein